LWAARSAPGPWHILIEFAGQICIIFQCDMAIKQIVGELKSQIPLR